MTRRSAAIGALAATVVLGSVGGVAVAAQPTPVDLAAPIIEIGPTDGRLVVVASPPQDVAELPGELTWFFTIDGPPGCTIGGWQPGDPLPDPQPGCQVVRSNSSASQTFTGLNLETSYRVRAAYQLAAPQAVGQDRISPLTVADQVSARAGADVQVTAASEFGTMPAGIAPAGRQTGVAARFAAQSDGSAGDTLSYEWDLTGDGVVDKVGRNVVSWRFERVGPVTVTVTAKSPGFSATRHLAITVVPAPNSRSNALSVSSDSLGLYSKKTRTAYLDSRSIDIRPLWAPATAATHVRIATDPLLTGARTLPLGHYLRWWLAAPGSEHVLYAEYLDWSGAVVASGLMLQVVVYDTPPTLSSARLSGRVVRLKMPEPRRLVSIQTKYKNGDVRKTRVTRAEPPRTLRIRTPSQARWIRLQDAADNVGPWRRIT